MYIVRLIFIELLVLLIERLLLVHGVAIYTAGGAQVATQWTAAACSGNAQSPIDIPLKAQFAKYGPIVFTQYGTTFRGTVQNNLKSLSVKLDHGSAITIEKGGLPEKFIFTELHFHWPSEHTIEGVSYPLEVHLVHYNSKYTAADAINHADGYAVLGILYHISEKDSLPLNVIINSARDGFTGPATGAQSTAKTPEQIVNGLSLKDFLPDSHCSFFRYRGSLTTPDCNEVVTWTVFLDTLPVSISQLEKLRTIPSNAASGNFLIINSRPSKPRNGRIVSFQSSLHCRIGAHNNINTIPWMLRPFLFFNRF